MHIRKLAAAAGFATGAALAFAPLASADTSSSWLSSIDALLGGLSTPAASTLDYQISFNGVDLLPIQGNEATAETIAGQFGLAIASGDGAKAIAEGGIGDNAMASGNNAVAEAGSTATGAHNFNFDSATDIGNNAAPSTYTGAPDGAYAGGGSLIGGVDSGTTGSSNDTAQLLGNDTGTITTPGDFDGGNSGAFAGDSALIGDGATAGNGDTAYTSGNINGFGDGSAAVAGSNDSAYTTGTETGQNEGAFSGFGNNNSATADTNYSSDGNGVSAIDGNGNYAFADGPANSDASAGGENITTLAGNNNIAIVNDPFGSTADSATAGSGTAPGSSDLAEVLYTHGNAVAQNANNVYDIISAFGNAHSAAATAASDPAATDITSTVNSEIASLNSIFQGDLSLAGVPATDYTLGGTGVFDTINSGDVATVEQNTTFDDLVYGLNPANETTDPGAYDVFNGALARFDDAINFGVYALENGGAAIPTADFATDLFGNTSSLTTELAGLTASQAVTDLLGNGFSDLLGYF
jgi:hypothetical protein